MKTKDAMRDEPAAPGDATLRRRLLPLLITACFSGAALANPAGPQVVNGQVGFAQQGSTLSITNTPGAIINWQSFSIHPGELTRFIQQHPGSAVLNRIVGQDPSQILGALQSNGRVFLVNPNGILFGAGAQVNVNGLVASTLNISNQDFLLGKMHFAAGDKAAALKNQGAITTPAGGQVYLIAPNVENSGIITSPKGEVLLAAGHTVQLVDSMNPDLHVVLSAPDNEALNLGQVIAQGGKTGIYGALIKQRGIVNANSAVVGENGKIVFKASKDSLLEAGSVTTATGEGKGGEIHVLGERVGLTGDVMIDASGKQGGGTVLVGGDYQGKNVDIRNAKATYAGMDTTIKADAIDSGEGGKVIVWADDTMRSYGHISARGGAQGGNGGFVETSGKFLDMQGSVDTRAPKGTAGTLLLDPTNIYIAIDEASAGMGPLDTSAEGGDPNFAASSTVSDSLLTVSTLQNALVNGSVKVTTTNAAGGGSGIINVVDGITWGNGSTLSLEAEGGIIVNGAISNSAGGTLGLRTTSGDITQSAPISVPSLFAYADVGSVVLNNPGNSVTTLAGWAGNAGTGFSFNNAGGLTIGMVSTELGTSNGIATYNNKPISLTAGGALNIENTIDSNGGNTAITAAGNVTFTAAGKILTDNGQLALSSSAPGGNISLVSGAQISTGNGLATLKADKMSLVGTVSAGTNAVELMPYTADISIGLGNVGDIAANTLELSATELSQVTAGTLRIGDVTSGSLQITDVLAGGAGNALQGVSTALSLVSGGIISQALGKTIDGGSSVKAHGYSVALTEPNSTGVIAGAATGGDFQYRSTSLVTVNEVDGTSGITASGNILLDSGSSLGINQAGGKTLTAAGLALKSMGPVLLNDPNNAVGKVVADLKLGGLGSGVFEFSNSVNLEVGGELYSIDGIATNNQGIRITTGNNSTLTVTAPINAGTDTSTSRVSLQADGMVFNTETGTDAVKGVDVGLRPYTTGLDITVGATTCAPPCLALGDLYKVNAPTIGIGTDDASNLPGNITVAGLASGSTDPGHINANTTRIGLLSGGSVGQTGAIAVQDLGVKAAGPVTLNQANTVTKLAAKVSGTGNGFTFNNSTGVNVTTLSGGTTPHNYNLSGIETNNGAISITTAGDIDVSAPIIAGTTGAVSLTTIASGGIVQLTGGYVQGGSLNATTEGGIGDADPLVTRVGSLVASNTGAAKNIFIANSNSPSSNTLTLQTISQTGAGGAIGITNIGPLVVAGVVSTTDGAIHLKAASPLTVNTAVSGASVHSASGSIMLEAGASGSSADVLTINGDVAQSGVGGAVVYSPGNITLKAGDAIKILGAIDSAAAGSVTLQSFMNGTTTSSPKPTLGQCAANPSLSGCTTVLPTLSDCTIDPTKTGCTAVLPTLAACAATPTLAGCTAVLPTVDACTATPTLAGCAVILPTMNACTATPTLAGCTAVLPTLLACAATPTLAGCTVVLPTLAACVATPTLAGCNALLPTAATCAATPSLPGCAPVPPVKEDCTANSSLPGCSPVAPPLQTATEKTLDQVQSLTENLLLSVSEFIQQAAASQREDNGGKSSTQKEGGQNDRKTTAGPNDKGVNKNEPAKKMYCN